MERRVGERAAGKYMVVAYCNGSRMGFGVRNDTLGVDMKTGGF